MTQEALKQMYQLLLTEPHAPTVCLQLEAIAREALAQPEQEPVKPTAQEVQNAAANLALMREMFGDPNQPAAKVNDEGFIVETGLLLSPGALLYTTPPQRTEQNFCPRCGKRTKDLTHIHTCTPPQGDI